MVLCTPQRGAFLWLKMADENRRFGDAENSPCADFTIYQQFAILKIRGDIMSNCYLKYTELLQNAQNSGEYWQKLPFYKALEDGERLEFTSPVTFLVGENGCGKSTLIEAIAVAMGFNAEGGTRNFDFETHNSVSGLCDELELGRVDYEEDGFFLRAESLFNVATEIERLDSIPCGAARIIESYGGKSLHEQSHGETFLSLVRNRLFGKGFYILDEPEAALSPMRQLDLIAEIGRLVRADSQFIIATHSPILLTYPNAKIYKLDNGIEPLSYEQTDHYRVTKGFLDNPAKYLDQLININRGG